MSMSLVGRVLRPATLLVAGLLLAQATLSITTSPTSAATTQTRVASCAGLNFHPIDDRTTYRWDGRIMYRYSNAGDGWFLCDPHLPNKAVVTRVRFTLKDVIFDSTVRNCALVRGSLSSSTGANQVLGLVSETGMAAEPGTVRRSDSSISRATIDNSAYGYWLQCEILFDDGLVSQGGSYAGIIGADVTYKISSANG